VELGLEQVADATRTSRKHIRRIRSSGSPPGSGRGRTLASRDAFPTACLFLEFRCEPSVGLLDHRNPGTGIFRGLRHAPKTLVRFPKVEQQHAHQPPVTVLPNPLEATLQQSLGISVLSKPAVVASKIAQRLRLETPTSQLRSHTERSLVQVKGPLGITLSILVPQFDEQMEKHPAVALLLGDVDGLLEAGQSCRSIPHLGIHTTQRDKCLTLQSQIAEPPATSREPIR